MGSGEVIAFETKKRGDGSHHRRVFVFVVEILQLPSTVIGSAAERQVSIELAPDR